MTRVLVVDDEKEIRQGLVSRIPWISMGIDTVYEAEDGDTALEMVARHNPDILITDIRMARLGGLELIKELTVSGYKGVVIVISGYDEFQYAKEAFKLGVEDYLLKPIDIEEFRNAVLAALDRLKARNEEDQIRESYQQALPKLRETALRELMNRPFRPGAEVRLEYALVKLGLDWLLHGQLRLIVYSINNLGTMPEDRGEAERESLFIRVGKTLEQYWMQQVGRSIVVSQTKQGHFVVLLQLDAKTADYPWAENVTESCRIVQRGDDISLSVALAPEPGAVDRVNGMHRDALETLTLNKVLPAFQELGNDSEPFTPEEAKYLLSRTDELLELLRYGSNAEIIRAMEHFPSLAQAWEVTRPRDLQQRAFEWLLELFRAAQRTGWTHNVWEKNPIALWEQLERYDTLDSLRREVTQKLLDASASIRKQAVSRNQIVSAAERFVQARYGENLTLQIVASHVHVTPVWLSKLFKKESGMNFIDYLTDVRLKKAAELLMDVQYKVYQISGMVGYQDPVYFTRQFKKKYGRNPNEYRNQMSAGHD